MFATEIQSLRVVLYVKLGVSRRRLDVSQPYGRSRPFTGLVYLGISLRLNSNCYVEDVRAVLILIEMLEIALIEVKRLCRELTGAVKLAVR
jgi:hypothetical protein